MAERDEIIGFSCRAGEHEQRDVLTVDAKDFAVYRLSNGRALNNLLAR